MAHHLASNSKTSPDINTLSVFRDAKNLGILHITGKDTLDLINRMSTNNVIDIDPFHTTHTILTNDKGRIIDIIYVINMESYYLLITSPGQDQVVLNWLDKYTIMEDIEYSNQTSQFSISHILHTNPKTLFNISDTGTSSSLVTEINTPNFTSYLIPYHLGDLNSYLMIASSKYDQSIKEYLGNHLSFWDTPQYEQFRIAHKIPIHGNELSEEHNPLEAGLIGAIDFHKGCYIGQEVIARLDSYDKVQKHLSLIKINTQKHLVDLELFSDGKLAGIITSAQQKNNTDFSLGMAYIHKNHSKIGTYLSTKDGEQVTVLENPLLFGEEK